MPAALAASIIDFVLDLARAPTDQHADNRVSLEGLTFRTTSDDALEILIRRFDAAALRLASGALVLEVGQLALHELLAVVRVEGGRPRLCAFQAAGAELAGVNVHGPSTSAQQRQTAPHAAARPAATSWSLAPLAGANGTIRAEIVDAHLLFDADVTVPIREGRIDFDETTVEHVGPDSRMGVSRLGLYVDAPNGRSYLYQFASALVCGVEYERRGALVVANRGQLRLQEFAEGLLRQGGIARGQGFTEQARLLFDRTAVSGEVRLGDGTFRAPGVQGDLVGRAEGRNALRLNAEAVGRGITLELPAVSMRHVASHAGGLQLRVDGIDAALTLRVFSDGGQLRFALELAHMKLSGLRAAPQSAAA